jgi:hypothetical protein
MPVGEISDEEPLKLLSAVNSEMVVTKSPPQAPQETFCIPDFLGFSYYLSGK